MSAFEELLSRPGPVIMGILNVTPDSFSDGGAYSSTRNAVAHAIEMIREGADIIDIGGESTRPPGAAYGEGAARVSADEEISRVIPVIQAIRVADRNILISIDTQKSEVAELALEDGGNIINDVSAGTFDTAMFRTAANRQAPIILMHGHGPRFTKPRIEDYTYDDVVVEVYDYLAERISAAEQAGVKEILADVGVGFAKGYQDNLTLLKHHARFMSLDVPLVLGVSRKSTIGKAMGSNPPPKDRLIGSIAAACYGHEHGAKIIRTHNVKATREALSVMRAILQV